MTAGQTLTLTCTTSGRGPAGPVKWLKGWGSGNETVYEQTGSFPRVTRAVAESSTDFSIHIRDVQPEDAGTYYCVKFSKSLTGGDVVFRRGKGTEVSVHGEWGSQSSSRQDPAQPGAAPGTAQSIPVHPSLVGSALGEQGWGRGRVLAPGEGPVGCPWAHPCPCGRPGARRGWQSPV